MGNTSEPPREEIRDAIAQVVEHVAREDAETRAALNRRAAPRRTRGIIVAVFAAANVAAWAIFPPPRAESSDARSAEGIDRDLRLTIANTVTAVEEWRGSTGRLPLTLVEAGVTDSGMEFTRRDSAAYEIRGTDAGVRLTYRSGVPLADFLGTALSKAP